MNIDTARNELEDVLSCLVFQKFDGEYELGLLNVKSRTQDYLKRVEEILDSGAENAILLLHGLDESFDTAPYCAVHSDLINRTCAKEISMAELREYNNGMEEE